VIVNSPETQRPNAGLVPNHISTTDVVSEGSSGSGVTVAGGATATGGVTVVGGVTTPGAVTEAGGVTVAGGTTTTGALAVVKDAVPAELSPIEFLAITLTL
jgi:hypothetical protein